MKSLLLSTLWSILLLMLSLKLNSDCQKKKRFYTLFIQHSSDSTTLEEFWQTLKLYCINFLQTIIIDIDQGQHGSAASSIATLQIWGHWFNPVLALLSVWSFTYSACVHVFPPGSPVSWYHAVRCFGSSRCEWVYECLCAWCPVTCPVFQG